MSALSFLFGWEWGGGRVEGEEMGRAGWRDVTRSVVFKDLCLLQTSSKKEVGTQMNRGTAKVSWQWLEGLIRGSLAYVIDLHFSRASLVAQMVKNLLLVLENPVWSLGWEDPLETGMATHSSILAWGLLPAEEPCRLWSMMSQTVGHDWATNTSHFSYAIFKITFMGICIY